jgi:dienelactone hydrolase
MTETDAPVPRVVAHALWTSFACALAFTVFACVTTQDKPIRHGSPWQHDPYDLVVSFTLFLVPALAVLIVARARSLGREEPQPMFKIKQVLKAALVCTLLVAATVLTDWLAVIVRADHRLWNDGTPWLVAALAALTLAAAVAVALQRRAFRRLPAHDGREPGGDWLDDLSLGGATDVVRRHIHVFAAVASIAAALLITTVQAFGEGWNDPLLFLTEAAIEAGGFFGFAVICNSILRIAAPGPVRARRAPRAALTAGALAMPAAAALRDDIWPLLGDGGQVETTPQLAAVTVTGAVASALLAYAVSSMFGGRPTGRRRMLRVMAVFVLAVVTLSGAYLALVAVRHAQPAAWPAPTGSYRVGRAAFEWTDRTRTDPLAPRPGSARELSVWLWYPATPQAAGRPAAYAPGAWEELHPEGLLGLGLSSFDAIRTHALERVPVAAGRFPVVVMEPGLGLAAPQYTALAENLASHGYLVAGVTPTYSANLTVLHGRPVGRTTAGNPPAFDTTDPAAAARAGAGLVAVWAADARFAAAQVAGLGQAGPFAGHVDPARTAYFGHSLGGASALEACRTDPRCAGAADLDGTQFSARGLNKPMMIIGSANSCVTGTCRPDDPMARAERDTARSLLAASTGPAWCYQIDGTQHFNFTDYAAYYLAAPIRPLVPLGTIDGGLGLTITNAYLAAFLDHTVRGTDEPLLTGAASPYPQVRAQHVPQ